MNIEKGKVKVHKLNAIDNSYLPKDFWEGRIFGPDACDDGRFDRNETGF